jgi:hypothetical protein
VAGVSSPSADDERDTEAKASYDAVRRCFVLQGRRLALRVLRVRLFPSADALTAPHLFLLTAPLFLLPRPFSTSFFLDQLRRTITARHSKSSSCGLYERTNAGEAWREGDKTTTSFLLPFSSAHLSLASFHLLKPLSSSSFFRLPTPPPSLTRHEVLLPSLPHRLRRCPFLRPPHRQRRRP